MRSLLAALLLITPSAALSADWVKIASNDVGDNYIDKETIKRIGGYIRAWQKVTFNNNNEVRQIIVLTEFDCRLDRSRNVYFHSYMKSGEVEQLDAEDDWSYIAPGTLGSDILKYVCGAEAVEPYAR